MRLKNTHFKKRKGNAEMSVCNSPVAVVTKDLLVLFLSPGFWPLAPLTEQSQPVAISTLSFHYLYISPGHAHPSICSQHTPTSSPPPPVCIFSCSLFLFPSPLEILLVAISVLTALMLETAYSHPRARFLPQGQRF